VLAQEEPVGAELDALGLVRAKPVRRRLAAFLVYWRNGAVLAFDQIDLRREAELR
jgi:hypothetical protein